MESLKEAEKKWNKKIHNERDYWMNHLIGEFLTIPEFCGNCKSYHIKSFNNDSLNNPILLDKVLVENIYILIQYNL